MRPYHFNINNKTWSIEEKDQEFFRKEFKLPEDTLRRYFGLCDPEVLCIYLLEGMNMQQQQTTLLHELMHCYIASCCSAQEEFDEEDVCTLASNAHTFLQDTLEEYLGYVAEATDDFIGCEGTC